MIKSPGNNCKDILYFDNNGTTFITNKAQEILKAWSKCANPSSDSKISEPGKNMMSYAKTVFSDYCNAPESDYDIIFTSGASESNTFVIKQTALAYSMVTKRKPHIIISCIEHHASISAINDLLERKSIDVTWLQVDKQGFINTEELRKSITPNTCLITIMMANNESGVILDVYTYSKIAYEHKIPFHTDAVQVLGKATKIDMKSNNITMLSGSAHKFFGPKGVGILILDKKFITGYKVKALVCGTQQNHLRGGTENIAGIASMTVALIETIKDRETKLQKMNVLRSYIIEKLGKEISIGSFSEYYDRDDEYKNAYNEIVLLSPHHSSSNATSKALNFNFACLPNTIFLSIVKNVGDHFCNIKFKQALDIKKVVVSITSSCLTKEAKASHVLYAMKAPKVVRKGVIRISFSDYTTKQEVDKFLKIFSETMKEHLGNSK